MSEVEIRTLQKETLAQLRRIEKANNGLENRYLTETITNTKVKMTSEDIAWVEKMLSEENA